MKSNVTVEELNAATLLMTGIQVNHLVEVHIAGSNVTAITADDEGNLITRRIPIGVPAPPPTPDQEFEHDLETEEIQESPDHEETDEDDGTQEE